MMKMQYINKLFSLRWTAVMSASLALFSLSCTKTFQDTNTNKNTIATITPATLPFLFSHAEDLATVNANNYQVAQNLFADQYIQYFACEATYFPSDRLVIRQDWVGANFNPYYSGVRPALHTGFSITAPLSAEHALGDVIWALPLPTATDYSAPIPFLSACKTSTSCAYAPQ